MPSSPHPTITFTHHFDNTAPHHVGWRASIAPPQHTSLGLDFHFLSRSLPASNEGPRQAHQRLQRRKFLFYITLLPYTTTYDLSVIVVLDQKKKKKRQHSLEVPGVPISCTTQPLIPFMLSSPIHKTDPTRVQTQRISFPIRIQYLMEGIHNS